MDIVTIQRVRLRASRPNSRFPWRFAYVVPREAYSKLFEMFGPCFSHAANSELTGGNPDSYYGFHIDYSTCDGAVDEDRKLRPDFRRGDLLVVPLRRSRYTDALNRLVDTRVLGEEVWSQKQTGGTARHLKVLAGSIPATTAAVHLGPRPEDVHQLCTLCKRVEEHLMGSCTPGMAQCNYSAMLPEVHRYRKERNNRK